MRLLHTSWCDSVFSGAFISWCSVLPCRVFKCHFADQCGEDCHHHHHTHPFAARGPGDQVRHGFGFFCYFQGEKVTPVVAMLLLDSFSVSPWVALILLSLASAGIPPNQSRNLSLSSKHPREHRWGPFLFLPCWLGVFPSNFLKLFLPGIFYKVPSIKINNFLWGVCTKHVLILVYQGNDILFYYLWKIFLDILF